MPNYVLVIDDNRLIADNLVKMLTLLGHRARAVYGSPSAMQTLVEYPPSLVMVDIHMQGINGVEVVRFIRRNEKLAHTRVLAMSSDNQPDLISAVNEAGANEFLPKPVRLEDLESALQRIGVQPPA